MLNEFLETNKPISIDDEIGDNDTDIYVGYATNTVTNSGTVGFYCIYWNEYGALAGAKEALYHDDLHSPDWEEYYEKECLEYQMTPEEFWEETLHLNVFKISREEYESFKNGGFCNGNNS